jgi:stearoyl-CoA desaturase (delta-9 desaturase)
MPTRDQLLAEAQAMFAKTKSLDDIVDRAHELLVKSVSVLLAVAPVVAGAEPKSKSNVAFVSGHPHIR